MHIYVLFSYPSADEALAESIFQFVGDGIETVAAFIAGMLNTLVVYPEEQEKLHSEIMEVVGPNRQPTAEDKPNLPYTNAFLNEYVRTSKFLPFFPSLECTSMCIFYNIFYIKFTRTFPFITIFLFF